MNVFFRGFPALSSAVFTAAGLFALFVPTYAHAQDTIFNHIPPSTNALVCVNVHKLANDPLTSQILSSRALREVNQKILQVSAATGIDPQKDLEQFCFARDMAAEEDQSVLLLKGRFDPSRIRPLLQLATSSLETSTIEPVQDVLVWHGDEHDRNYLAFLPDGIAVLTFAPESIRSAIAGNANSPVEQYAPKLSSIAPNFRDAIAWAHLANPATFSDDPTMKSVPVKSVDAVLDADSHGISATVHAEIESVQRAKDLLDMANGFLALARFKDQTIANRVSLTTDETSKTLIAKLNYSRPELLQMAKLLNGHNDYERNLTTEPKELAKIQADLARKNADFARKRADIARKQADLLRKKADMERAKLELERSIKELDLQRVIMTSETIDSEIQPPPPVKPAPPVSPKPPAEPFSRGGPHSSLAPLPYISEPSVSTEQIQAAVQQALETALPSAMQATKTKQQD